MKCSISAGHSCNVIRVAITQNERATQKRWGGLPVAVCEPPLLCPQQGTAIRSRDVPEWGDWFGLWGSVNTDTSWDEINHGPQRASWKCVSLIPGSLWRHVTPVFLPLLCLPSLPEVAVLMFSFHRVLFSPLCFFGNTWLWAVSQLWAEEN